MKVGVHMLTVTVKKEIINQMGRLNYEHQRRVLDFALSLVVTGLKGVRGKRLLSFGGTFLSDDLTKRNEKSCRR